jgi:hypothetical protein
MLGTGFKNVILFILIILILHFLIKNAILERKNAGKEHLSPAPTNVTSSRQNTTSIINTPSKDNVISSMKHTKTPAEHKQELFKYVMEEDNIEKFFEPTINTILPEPNDKFENEYNIACDARNAVTETIADRKKFNDPPDQNNNFLVIHKYQDESTLNGGKLLGGLDGYDEYNTMFQSYKCGTDEGDESPPKAERTCLSPRRQFAD